MVGECVCVAGRGCACTRVHLKSIKEDETNIVGIIKQVCLCTFVGG